MFGNMKVEQTDRRNDNVDANRSQDINSNPTASETKSKSDCCQSSKQVMATVPPGIPPPPPPPPGIPPPPPPPGIPAPPPMPCSGRKDCCTEEDGITRLDSSKISWMVKTFS